MTHAFGLLRELGLFVLGVLVAIAVAAGALLIATWLGDMRSRRRRAAASGATDATRLRARMRRLARPTLLLVPANAPGFSKIGGKPELPNGAAWPELRGRPCVFVAQIDLAALRPHASLDWLPDSGLVFAFVDLDGFGFADQAQVLFHPSPAGDCQRLMPPGQSFPERRVAFEAYVSTPSLDWLGVDLAETDLSSDELDELADMPDEPFGDEIQHRIGGYPSEIQDVQMAVACELIRRGLSRDAEVTPAILKASKAWRLLLQIDSDPALNINWGDGGRVYVFVREQDSKAGDFSRTITISQTH